MKRLTKNDCLFYKIMTIYSLEHVKLIFNTHVHTYTDTHTQTNTQYVEFYFLRLFGNIGYVLIHHWLSHLCLVSTRCLVISWSMYSKYLTPSNWWKPLVRYGQMNDFLRDWSGMFLFYSDHLILDVWHFSHGNLQLLDCLLLIA